MSLCIERSSPALVKPWEKTPSGNLELSGMDKVPVLRCNARTLHVYKSKLDVDDHESGQLLTSESEANTSSDDEKGRGACEVIREGLSRALVPYYPLAGRLRTLVSGDVFVECNAEGVLFVEASANTTLHRLNYLDFYSVTDCDVVGDDSDIKSRYDYNDLLPQHLHGDVNDDQPLVQMQVTQFKCGGFVIGLILCHTVCDGLGAAQFLNAVGEFARGLHNLSVQPVWCRDSFVTKAAPTPQPLLSVPVPLPNYKLEQATVDISAEEINELKRKFEEETGGRCSSFEAVTAALWSCRTKAISSSTDDPSSPVKLVFFANCRKMVEPPLPEGFYGNCFFPVTVTAPKQLVGRAPASEVVKLIQKAKAELRNEFAHYMKNENDPFTAPLSYETVYVSEWGRLGFNEVDMGWGPPIHLVPIQGSPVIPASILGWQSAPNRGLRLMTWCVHISHRKRFLHLLNSHFPTSSRYGFQ